MFHSQTVTDKEYRAALNALGLTKSGAARLLGVEPRTSRYWWDGDRKVPPPVANFLNFLIAAGIKPEEVMEALQIGE